MRKAMGMKYFNLRWIPHLLISNQKATRLEVAKVMMMTKQVAIHVNAGFQRLGTSHEHRIARDSMLSRMYPMARSHLDPIVNPTNRFRHTTMTVVFGMNSTALQAKSHPP
jgi:hypothetical protein